MRRKDRQITDVKRMMEIVEGCEILRLGLASEDGYPYIVPVNFAYQWRKEELYLYAHGAVAGRKYEMLQAHPHCSFEMDIALGLECIPEQKDVTMRYQSVMGKADVRFLAGEEKQRAIDEILMARHAETRDFAYNPRVVAATAVMELRVSEWTAKANLPGGGAD